MKARASPPVEQVNQFESEILLLQRPIEQEDVRDVVFNHEDAGRETIEACCKFTPRAGKPPGRPFIISHLTDASVWR